ncbi:MAG: TldE/PmbA family protein [Betaproteobacteria bacterium]|nr:TldE/PmbA family protein [Betaproteobacteria bacterium]
MQTYFYQLADFIGTQTRSEETYLAYLSAEESNFVRFNQCLVRQAGSVKQTGLTLSLIAQQRRAESHLTLSGQREDDRGLVLAALDALRRDLADLPEDPYLLFNQIPQSTERIGESGLASDADILDQVVTLGQGKDLVGIYAAGTIYKGFANSLGQRNWHRVDNFNFEWCLYHAADKAVKNSYAGTHWDGGEFARKMAASSEQLAVLKRAPKQLAPGQYRAYLAPSAMNEILGLLSWEAFGIKTQRNKQSPLLKLEDGSAALNASVDLQENSQDGIAPGFQADGFIKSATVPLISRGHHAGALVSPRSAREFALETNGANSAEAPEALEMAAGYMHRDDVLKTLGTGILIGNLHYLNFSDRRACRMTGMTRFATFWVEKGVIQAPLNVMRFDDSAYRVLGDNLLALTAERELILDSGTYGERSTGSARLPGALVKDFALTL